MHISPGFAFIIPTGSKQDNHHTIVLNDAETHGEALLVTLTTMNLQYDTLAYKRGDRLYTSITGLPENSKLCCHLIRTIPTYELKDIIRFQRCMMLGNVKPLHLDKMIDGIKNSDGTEPEILRKMSSLGL